MPYDSNHMPDLPGIGRTFDLTHLLDLLDETRMAIAMAIGNSRESNTRADDLLLAQDSLTAQGGSPILLDVLRDLALDRKAATRAVLDAKRRALG